MDSLSRRAFVGMVGGMAAGVAAGAALPSLPSRPQPQPQTFAMPDDPLSIAFARALGDQPLLIFDDPVRFWRSWRDATNTRPLAVAGLTSWAAFVTLRGLALDDGLRPVHEALHDPRIEENGGHRILIGDPQLATLLQRAGRAWTTVIASHLRGGRAPIWAPRSPIATESLRISWVLRRTLSDGLRAT